jgi:hypothetical protein
VTVRHFTDAQFAILGTQGEVDLAALDVDLLEEVLGGGLREGATFQGVKGDALQGQARRRFKGLTGLLVTARWVGEIPPIDESQ